MAVIVQVGREDEQNDSDRMSGGEQVAPFHRRRAEKRSCVRKRFRLEGAGVDEHSAKQLRGLR